SLLSPFRAACARPEGPSLAGEGDGVKADVGADLPVCPHATRPARPFSFLLFSAPRPLDSADRPRYLEGIVGFNHSYPTPAQSPGTMRSFPPLVPSEDGMQLAQRLVKKGILPAHDLARVAEEHAATPGKPLHLLLVERGFCKEEDVLPVL